MKLDRYEFKSSDKFLTYEFLSEGPKGKIPKLIQFSLVNQDSLFFNLAFGDKNPETGEIDDMVITDNGDSEKVLATVVAAVYAFCDRFLKHGFMPLAVRQQERGFAKWVSTNILILFRRIIKFLD